MAYCLEWDLKVNKAWIVKGKRDAIPYCWGNTLSKGTAMARCLGSGRPLGCLLCAVDLQKCFSALALLTYLALLAR